LEEEIMKLKMENVRLTTYEREYREIRDKPTSTTYNSTINKLNTINIGSISPFTLDTVKNRLQNGGYTYDLFLMGKTGMNQFILNIITKDDELNYATTDVSRPNFHRLEESRQWVGDKGAKFLGKVFDELAPVAHTYFEQLGKEKGVATDKKARADVERLDSLQTKVKPMVCGLLYEDSNDRKTLLTDVIKYIKPHVAI